MVTDRPCRPRCKGTERKLLSLIGRLHHASRVVKPGRAFIRSYADAKADIAWWNSFISIWNEVSLIPPPFVSATCSLDASGSWGCGATYNGDWFQLAWPVSWRGVSISSKELVPVVVAAALWGPRWKGRKILCLCDSSLSHQQRFHPGS